MATLFTASQSHAAGRRRAVLVGINDYTARKLPAVPNQRGHDRDWANLNGAVNDVQSMRDMLVLLYGFAPADIVTLTDHHATRAAILEALDHHLGRNAGKDDTLFFYFAGHGSQVRNSLSDEADKLDESLVPADSRAGAADIRDKELRPRLNQMLARGARVTVLLDSCHSGSGARGLPTGARARGIDPDLRDVRDRSAYGPRPEELGAVIISATQDHDSAWETRDAEGRFHGAFSWAWLRSMRDAPAGEPVAETFLRAQARLRGETPYQDPVFGAGRAETRLAPFLGVRADRRAERTIVGVEKIRADGTVVLRGGWANGLAVGSELLVLNDGGAKVRIAVTALNGLGQAEGRIIAADRSVPGGVRAGALAEVAAWAAPATRPLRVWMPRTNIGMHALEQLARSLADAAERRGIRWVTSPSDVTPTHVLRRRTNGWQMIAGGGKVEVIGSDAAAMAAVTRLPSSASLFVHFPAPAALAEALGARVTDEGVESVAHPEEADYMLVGRFAARRLAYAWVRPSVSRADAAKSGLPLRSDWTAQDGSNDRVKQSVHEMRAAVLRLRKIHAWNQLESPPGARYPYSPAIRRTRDGELPRDRVLIGGETYHLALHAPGLPATSRVSPRYVYAFSIDSYGKSTLLFPRNGSVENRFPLVQQQPPHAKARRESAPSEISLGNDAMFAVEAPYGVDTYYLLTTDEPLPNPWILEWAGARSRDAQPATALERLLMLIDDPSRSARAVTPANWSIERVIYASTPPK